MRYRQPADIVPLRASDRSSRERFDVKMQDLVLVSVDDHLVEPPDLFDKHIPAKYKNDVPKLIQREDGTDAWVFEGQEATNVGLNAVAGRPPEEYGTEPTKLSEIREGCYDIHERIRDMNANGVAAAYELPVLSAVLRTVLRPRAGQGSGIGRAAGVQRLAHRPVVRRVSRTDDSPSAAADLGSYADGGGGAACGGEGMPRSNVLRKPDEAGVPVAARSPLGSVLASLQRREHRGQSPHRFVVVGCDHVSWMRPSTP